MLINQEKLANALSQIYADVQAANAANPALALAITYMDVSEAGVGVNLRIGPECMALHVQFDLRGYWVRTAAENEPDAGPDQNGAFIQLLHRSFLTMAFNAEQYQKGHAVARDRWLDLADGIRSSAKRVQP